MIAHRVTGRLDAPAENAAAETAGGPADRDAGQGDGPDYVEASSRALALAATVDHAPWGGCDIAAALARGLAALDHLDLEALRAARARPVAISFASDAAMQALNRRFRGHDRPTNILAFPAAAPAAAEDPAAPLGDLALGWESVAREAAAAGIAREDHLAHLLIHGLLHLLGYDHQDEADAALMEALEARACAAIGVANPYESANSD